MIIMMIIMVILMIIMTKMTKKTYNYCEVWVKNCHFKDCYLAKKGGQKIRAWVDPPGPPPSFGQCPKESVFFLLMSSLKSIQQFWIIPFVFFIMTHHPTFVLNYSLSFIIPTILVAQLQGGLRIRAVWTFHKFARDSQKSTKRFCISVNSKSSFHFDVFFYFWAICFGWMVS